MGVGEHEGRRDRRTGEEGLEDTQETRKIRSGERCLSNCCKSSAGPCKLSDKLRVLEERRERATHTQWTHTDFCA